MSLSSLYIDAFFHVAKEHSFSKAAKSLFISQSALSQRVSKLEEELGVNLFIRDQKKILLTSHGERLLVYCRNKIKLEEQFLHGLEDQDGFLTGSITIGAFSTFTRSRLIPLIGQIKQDNPKIDFHVLTKEVYDLFPLLKSGHCDFIYTTDAIEKSGVVCKKVGEEKNFLIESSNPMNLTKNIFLDHDESDQTTKEFLKLQSSKKPVYRSIYFDEIYSIIDGVAEGLGRAVVPYHLVKNDARIKVVANKNPLIVPVYLVYMKVQFPTKLQEFLYEDLKTI